MIISGVDARSLWVGLYKQASWFNFKTSTQAAPVWEYTFDAAKHLQKLSPDATFPMLQTTQVQDYAVIACWTAVMFVDGVPIGTLVLPPNHYLGPYPGVVSVH
jgi:hypothetical protein